MKTSYLDLENKHGSAYATVYSLLDLMYSVENGEQLDDERIRMIGRSGVEAAEKMKKAFDKLMDIYLQERGAREALEAGRAQS